MILSSGATAAVVAGSETIVLTSLRRTLPFSPVPVTVSMSMPLSLANCCAPGEALTFFFGGSARVLRSFTEILSLAAVPLKSSGTVMPFASAKSSAALLAKREVFFSLGGSRSFLGRRPFADKRSIAAARSAGLFVSISSMIIERFCAEVAIVSELFWVIAVYTHLMWRGPNLDFFLQLQKKQNLAPGARHGAPNVGLKCNCKKKSSLGGCASKRV